MVLSAFIYSVQCIAHTPTNLLNKQWCVKTVKLRVSVHELLAMCCLVLIVLDLVWSQLFGYSTHYRITPNARVQPKKCSESKDQGLEVGAPSHICPSVVSIW